jgi:hypothetical protein
MTAEQWVNNKFTKQMISEDIYASKEGIVQSHIQFAKQLLSEYTDKIVENAKTRCLNMESFGSENQCSCSECEYHITDKESITEQLPLFLKEKGL